MYFVFLYAAIYFIPIQNKNSVDNGIASPTYINQNLDKAIEIDSINWDTISISPLPISSDDLINGKVILNKYCCYPYCDKDYQLNEIDSLFSNCTEYITEANHFDNGHPSEKQGYFGVRLPDMESARVLLFSYFDIEASDYKTCTIEIQIFDLNNKIIDKKIIQDGLYYECGWSREFSINQDYFLKINDNSQCVEIGDVAEMTDEIKVEYQFQITSKGIVEIKDETNK